MCGSINSVFFIYIRLVGVMEELKGNFELVFIVGMDDCREWGCWLVMRIILFDSGVMI